ncbi:MAG TPA: hypothetical protein VLI72_15220 [Methylibium sp.]|nr:hypothetical protein [Methylibium sp.]
MNGVPNPAKLAGRLTLCPGSERPIHCERPIVSAEGMRRLTAGRRAAMLPDLLGAVFALCGTAHRLTARRAVDAALGLAESAAEAQRAAQLLRLATTRELLHRLAFDLPTRVPVAGLAVGTWLQGAPWVQTLNAVAAQGSADQLERSLEQLPRWIEQRLIGGPSRDWLRAWRDDPPQWTARWAARHAHPVARWFDAVRARAAALALPCRPLALLDAPAQSLDTEMRALAQSLATEAGFAQRPRWRGQPAETGPWTRACSGADGAIDTVWLRLAARLPDLLRVASDEQALRHGALCLGDGAGIAWSEMARGLLVHWVQLEPGADDPVLARVAACRVLAPTEWNFHPEGALARALRDAPWSADEAVLAAAALDPCIEIAVETETEAEASHA